MSTRSTRICLWLAALATVPVPYFLPEGESAPTLRLAFLTGLMTLVYSVEGPGPLVSAWVMAIVQLLVWSGVLYAGAGLVTRTLAALRSAPRSLVTAAIVAALLSMSMFPIYETPLSSTRLRSNALHLFE